MEKNKIGKFIANKRKEKGYTQIELGNILYVTDKAISKWERGVSLPDVTIINDLAKVLDVSVNDILNGEVSENKIDDVKEEIERIKKDINKKNKNKLILIVCIFILIMIVGLFSNISFGYKNISVIYEHTNNKRIINIGIPRTSFMKKYNDKSYSFKNFRNKNILENEIKKYFKTLKYMSCNDTIYYYNEVDDYSITSYSVTNHILYNTISYTISDGDYCFKNKLHEYKEKLGSLGVFHSMNGVLRFSEDWDDLLQFAFVDNRPNDDGSIYSFKATVIVRYYERISDMQAYHKTLEESIGDFEIKDDKLYYYRTKIMESDESINIPEVSIFKIEDTKLILQNNYLSKYYDDAIILK